MWLRPGDLQLLGNHNLVHMRTQFEDHEVQRRGAGPGKGREGKGRRLPAC